MKDSIAHCYWIVAQENCKLNQREKEIMIGNEQWKEERVKTKQLQKKFTQVDGGKNEINDETFAFYICSELDGKINAEKEENVAPIAKTRKETVLSIPADTSLWCLLDQLDDGYVNKRWFVLTFIQHSISETDFRYILYSVRYSQLCIHSTKR